MLNTYLAICLRYYFLNKRSTQLGVDLVFLMSNDTQAVMIHSIEIDCGPLLLPLLPSVVLELGVVTPDC